MRRPDIERLLPTVFQLALHPPDGWALEELDRQLGALLEVMEALHQPIEDVLDRLETTLDPRRSPPRFVPWLCGWLDLEWLVTATPDAPLPTDADLISTGIGRLREVVALGTELSRWRGTAQGLLRFLTTATGEPGFEIDEAPVADGRPIPFHIVVTGPAAAATFRPLVDRIVVAEKPAYVTHELRFAAA